MNTGTLSLNKRIPIQKEADVIYARLQTREIARMVGLRISDQARISLAVSSLAHILRMGESRHGEILINYLIEKERSGIRITCILPPASGSKDPASIVQSLRHEDWTLMVDELDVCTAHANEIHIIATKWVM
jgi:anti-sigma regulatory factor (Ser/Thr protein kinase)